MKSFMKLGLRGSFEHEGKHRIGQLAMFIGQGFDVFSCTERLALNKLKMNTQAEIGALSCRVYGRFGMGRTHHQRRAGHKTVAVRLEDALIHLRAQTQIICSDYEPFHLCP